MDTVLSTEVANQPLEWVVRATSLSQSTPFSARLWNSFSTIEKFDSPLVEFSNQICTRVRAVRPFDHLRFRMAGAGC